MARVAWMTLPGTHAALQWVGWGETAPQLQTGEKPGVGGWGTHGVEARNVGDRHGHPSTPYGSVMSTGPLFPSAWDGSVAHCPDWRMSEWTVWGLESSVAGRTKAWLDIQTQNVRAKVKKSDRQTL